MRKGSWEYQRTRVPRGDGGEGHTAVLLLNDGTSVVFVVVAVVGFFVVCFFSGKSSTLTRQNPKESIKFKTRQQKSVPPSYI